MSSLLKITKIEKKEKTISVIFECSGEWNNYLVENRIENTYDEDIESVPDSIAIIPALCNLLPIAWVYDFEIEVDEIDQTFNEAVPKIIGGYQKMYPGLKFGGKIAAKKIVDNKYEAKNAGVLFSGGVDATTTAYRHLDEKPDIITVLGSDIRLDDKKGIETVNRFNLDFSKNHGLKYERIYSTFRVFLDEGKLGTKDELVKNGFAWWHEFQHGIGLIGLVAPLSYIRGYKTVYIASSYHKGQWGEYTCASDPLIDNELKYGKTATFHDGYELTRQDKVKFICDYATKHNLKPYLRVCWESSGGENCCHCEKCRRTYFAILAEKHDPSNFGLVFNDVQYKRMIAWYKRHLSYNFNYTAVPFYQAIQSVYIQNYKEEETPPELKWFRNVKIGGKKAPRHLSYVDKIRKRLGVE